MLERSQRSFGNEDRQLLEQLRRNSIGTTRFAAKSTFLAGAAGLALGLLWLVSFHRGDRGAPFWPIVALAAAGATVGFWFDDRRHKRERRDREAAAAARWGPIIEVGVVEHLIAEASKAVRLDDDEGNTAWLLQVGERQVLCVWDWPNDASERVEIDLVPGRSPTALRISWTGKALPPSRPKRRFKRGERQPEQGEVLDGTLEQLDDLLRGGRAVNQGPTARARAAVTPASKLADDVTSLGFYKYAFDDQIDGIKGEIETGAYDWYLAAGRGFDADAERLAQGGVKDLLDDMRPALDVEGVELGEIAESYNAERGYTLRVGADEHTMWGDGEASRALELTTTRSIALINERLANAGSQERVHVLHGGAEAVFVLLTPGIWQAIAESGIFRQKDVPAPM